MRREEEEALEALRASRGRKREIPTPLGSDDELAGPSKKTLASVTQPENEETPEHEETLDPEETADSASPANSADPDASAPPKSPPPPDRWTSPFYSCIDLYWMAKERLDESYPRRSLLSLSGPFPSPQIRRL